jgi:hypothetical protein
MILPDRSIAQIECTVLKNGEKSILIREDSTQYEVFIPTSQIQDWWFQESGNQEDLELKHLEDGDEVVFVLSYWICRKEGFI